MTTQVKERYAGCTILMVLFRDKGCLLLKKRCAFLIQPNLAHYSAHSSSSGKMMLANLSVPHWKTALSIELKRSFQTLMILSLAYESSFNKGLCEMQKGNQEHGTTHYTFMMRNFPKLVGTVN